MSRFGPHITKSILLPKIPTIAALLRSAIERSNHQEVEIAKAAREAEAKSAAAPKEDQPLSFCDKEILLVNLQTLEQICNSLANYLQHNEIANVADLAMVQKIIAEVFP